MIYTAHKFCKLHNLLFLLLLLHTLKLHSTSTSTSLVIANNGDEIKAATEAKLVSYVNVDSETDDDDDDDDDVYVTNTQMLVNPI